jgi:hypothetical protein
MNKYLQPDTLPAPVDNLFVAGSAYHILLAHLLAADKTVCPGDSLLLMKRQAQANFRELFAAIRADPRTPFRDVFFLDRAEKYKRAYRQWKDRQRLPALRNLLDAARPRRLFVFNETVLNQYLARRVRAGGGNVYGVEDGAAAYSDMQMKRTRLDRLKDKLVFGPWAKTIAVDGSSCHIDAFFAIFPELVRAELRHQDVRALPRAGLALFDALSCPAAYLRRLGVAPDDLACDVIYLLAHSRNFRHLPNYRTRLRDIILNERRAELRYALSYHPREKRRDLLDVAEHGIALIHHAVPAELVYLFNRGRLREIYGDIGTSLMSARWLLPEARAMSLMKRLELHSPPFERALTAINVEMR